MGYGIAYLGLRVPRSKIFGTPGPTCDHHDRVSHHDNFCPECGRKVVQKDGELADFVQVDGCEGLGIDEFTIRQFEGGSHVLVVLSSVSTEDELGDEHIKLNIITANVMGMEGMMLEFVPPGRLMKFKEYMTKHGLWNAEEFGIWPAYSY
jgi:hypothetical protein